jgi:hypothetical protein
MLEKFGDAVIVAASLTGSEKMPEPFGGNEGYGSYNK